MRNVAVRETEPDEMLDPSSLGGVDEVLGVTFLLGLCLLNVEANSRQNGPDWRGA